MARIAWLAVFVPGVIAGMACGAQADTWAREDVLQAVIGVGLAGPLGFVGLAGLQKGSTWLARTAGLRKDARGSQGDTPATAAPRVPPAKEREDG